MVSILEYLHQYVPVIKSCNGSGDYHVRVPFGGDQLTSARATTARKVRVTSKGLDALRGLVPFVGDWHAKVNFEEVCYRYYAINHKL